jgi:hypothetical protein
MISLDMRTIILIAGLAPMVNKRPRLEVGAQEEKLVKAFHSSPCAIVLIRLSSGRIIDVNAGFPCGEALPERKSVRPGAALVLAKRQTQQSCQERLRKTLHRPNSSPT